MYIGGLSQYSFQLLLVPNYQFYSEHYLKRQTLIINASELSLQTRVRRMSAASKGRAKAQDTSFTSLSFRQTQTSPLSKMSSIIPARKHKPKRSAHTEMTTNRRMDTPSPVRNLQPRNLGNGTPLESRFLYEMFYCLTESTSR